MQKRQDILDKYENLIARFKTLELAIDSGSARVETACKLGLQKLVVARNFAQIDEDILKVSLEKAVNDSNFFTELLSLEAKRLRFKEEALKCAQTKTKTKIST
jgi:hypothetical protein